MYELFKGKTKRILSKGERPLYRPPPSPLIYSYKLDYKPPEVLAPAINKMMFKVENTPSVEDQIAMWEDRYIGGRQVVLVFTYETVYMQVEDKFNHPWLVGYFGMIFKEGDKYVASTEMDDFSSKRMVEAVIAKAKDR